jgi:hypothetical protein
MGYERPLGVGRASAALPWFSDAGLLSDGERVIDLDTAVSERALYLGATKEQLDRAKFPRSPGNSAWP